MERNHENFRLTVQLARIDAARLAGLTNSVSTPAAVVRAKFGSAKDTVAGKCWDIVGLRLEKANAAQLQSFRNRYRGGMRVLEVRPKSIAADFGIKQGDILVGLHEWETVRWEDINYILNQNSLINGNDPVKFYVVRGQEVLYGNLKFASRPK